MRGVRTKQRNVQFQRLLAKSAEHGRYTGHHTLQGHTGMVVAAARCLLEARGVASLTAVGLPEALFERLKRIVLIGAFAHDLGKCSLHFQQMVRGTNRVQLVRHEAATLWLTWPGRRLGAWLAAAAGGDGDLMLALCAAAGHHRKFWSKAVASGESCGDGDMPMLVEHPDFQDLLRSAEAMTKLPLGPPPLVEAFSIRTGREPPEAFLAECEDSCRDLVRAEAQLLAVAKALVLNADVAGSAIPKSGESVSWIEAALSHRGDQSDFMQVVKKRLSGASLRPFQARVAAASAPITLVLAGCGSGKTIAAYHWAGTQYPGRQLWVTYPTTGTATEGYRDYVADPDLELDARLEHSRAEVDLEILGQSPQHAEDVRRDQDRLESLRCWGAKVVTSTVDSVLGLVQNHRRGLYAWAGIAHAAVVFDEIHAYDDALFGALLRFLSDVPGVPALLMTASLPAARRAALEQLATAARGVALHVVQGPSDLETIPRYHQQHIDDHWAVIHACVARGEKVLWVSNTVDRCREAARIAEQRGIDVTVYHSRFRYVDRLRRHSEVIEAFRRPGGILAVTTQVAEMSLDLSADLLISDCAPIPALIQRLGRLNRRASPSNPGRPKPFIVLAPVSAAPYQQCELDLSAQWLERLEQRQPGPLSQADLVTAWEDDSREVVHGPSAWFDGGFRTEPADLREPSPGIQVLLPQDASCVRSKAARAVSVALPMSPPRADWLQWPRLEGYVVPPEGAVEYDERTGGRWL